MKMSKLVCFLLALLLAVGSVSAVSASAPPYSKNFDSKADMLDALSVYADTFPNVDGYEDGVLIEAPQDYHLERKEIMIPELQSELYDSNGYSYAEAIYGGGVSYTFNSYRASSGSGTVRFLVYYHMNSEIITRNLDNLGSSGEDVKCYSGEIGGYDYAARETVDSSGKVRCDYNIAVGERLVVIYTEEAFSEDFLSSIEFDATGIMLPVYVQDSAEGDVSSDDEITDVLPEVKDGYNRYFFLMPDEWYNEYSDSAGIYWWEGTEAHSSWPGVKANKADAENVYYYDVPKDVTVIVWNNYIDLLMEDKESIMHLDLQTANISCTYYEPGESVLYPDGVPTFDGMIYVIDPDWFDPNIFWGNQKPSGDWYYYYGDGEYGTEPYSLGDVNCDGQVNIKDATAIQKHLASISTLSDTGLNLADADGDGQVNIKDATTIQKKLAGII